MAKPPEISPQAQAEFTNRLLHEFGAVLYSALKQNLRAISPRVPEETIRNLQYQIIEANAQDISAAFELSFQDSGRISEMRKIYQGKMVPLDVIREWVKKNRDQFSRVSGYQNQPQRLSEAKQIERIAWSIAINRKGREIRLRGRKKKQRTWLNPTFYGFANRLIGEFQTKQGDFLRQILAQGLDPLTQPQQL